MTPRSGTTWPALRARWWRTCIAWYALLALAWPSLGPLPFLIDDFGAHHDDVAVHASGTSGHDAGHHVDASAIPGSPTHPDDHNCAECEVLKHLSRCVLPTLVIAILAPVVVGIVTDRIAVAPPAAQVVAHLPPARAPPAPIA